MSTEPEGVSVEILDKEYMIACPPEEREALQESARQLNERLRQVRDSGKVLGTERMAIITALNVVHEMEQQRRQRAVTAATVQQDIDRLANKISGAVGRRQESESVD